MCNNSAKADSAQWISKTRAQAFLQYMAEIPKQECAELSGPDIVWLIKLTGEPYMDLTSELKRQPEQLGYARRLAILRCIRMAESIVRQSEGPFYVGAAKYKEAEL